MLYQVMMVVGCIILASVQVVGTYTCTIANDDGFFMFEVPSLPVTLRVTYIGYSSQDCRFRGGQGNRVRPVGDTTSAPGDDRSARRGSSDHGRGHSS